MCSVGCGTYTSTQLFLPLATDQQGELVPLLWLVHKSASLCTTQVAWSYSVLVSNNCGWLLFCAVFHHLSFFWDLCTEPLLLISTLGQFAELFIVEMQCPNSALVAICSSIKTVVVVLINLLYKPRAFPIASFMMSIRDAVTSWLYWHRQKHFRTCCRCTNIFLQ